MAAKGDAQVFKQWEAPATATVGLNFADRLVSLIRAASQDDVQPQAAKALENLALDVWFRTILSVRVSTR